MLYSQRRRPVFSVGGGSIPSAAYLAFCSRARRFLAFASRFSSLFSRRSESVRAALTVRRDRLNSRSHADVGAANLAVLGAVGARRLPAVALRVTRCLGSVYAYPLLTACFPPDLRGFYCAAPTEASQPPRHSTVVVERSAPTHRFRHVTHAIEARLRRLSLASWSSLVANDDKERLRRGEADPDSERAAVALMAITPKREGERGLERASSAGAIGALLACADSRLCKQSGGFGSVRTTRASHGDGERRRKAGLRVGFAFFVSCQA